MSSNYQDLRQSLTEMPHISKEQVEKWIKLQTVIDECESFLGSSDLQQAKSHIEQAKKILNQRTYTLVFFGGSGYGKSTLINALLGRNILPAGTGAAITGTIIYIEQLASRDGKEEISFIYLTQEELRDRIHKLCNSAGVKEFDITNHAERISATRSIGELIERRQRVGASQDPTETERADYQKIIQDFIDAYQNNMQAYTNGGLSSQSFPLTDPSLRNFLREDSTDRKVRLVKTATIKITPSISNNSNSDLLMKGYLRIVDLPGLGASMRLHEDITLEEMKREDTIIVVVADGRRIDARQTVDAVKWIETKRLFGLTGKDLDNAASKIFFAVNNVNDVETYKFVNDRAKSDSTIKNVLNHISSSYWQTYSNRAGDRPYFKVMAAPALYFQDPENCGVLKEKAEAMINTFRNIEGHRLGNISIESVSQDSTKEKLLEITGITELRRSLINFIKKERVQRQLQEANNRIWRALQDLSSYYETELDKRGIKKPYDGNIEISREQRYEQRLEELKRELPQMIGSAMKRVYEVYNNEQGFHSLIDSVVEEIKRTLQERINQKIDDLFETFSTPYGDDRDVVFSDIIWEKEGVEIPIRNILSKVQQAMYETLTESMPKMADVLIDRIESVLNEKNVKNSLIKAEYKQGYGYFTGSRLEKLKLSEAYDEIIARARETYTHACQQATMFQILKPYYSVYEHTFNRSFFTPDLEKGIDPQEVKNSFREIADKFFQDAELFTGLRRLLSLEVNRMQKTIDKLKEEMLKNHGRTIDKSELRQEMEKDLSSMNEVESFYSCWKSVESLKAKKEEFSV